MVRRGMPRGMKDGTGVFVFAMADREEFSGSIPKKKEEERQRAALNGSLPDSSMLAARTEGCLLQ